MNNYNCIAICYICTTVCSTWLASMVLIILLAPPLSGCPHIRTPTRAPLSTRWRPIPGSCGGWTEQWAIILTVASTGAAAAAAAFVDDGGVAGSTVVVCSQDDTIQPETAAPPLILLAMGSAAGRQDDGKRILPQVPSKLDHSDHLIDLHPDPKMDLDIDRDDGGSDIDYAAEYGLKSATLH